MNKKQRKNIKKYVKGQMAELKTPYGIERKHFPHLMSLARNLSDESCRNFRDIVTAIETQNKGLIPQTGYSKPAKDRMPLNALGFQNGEEFSGVNCNGANHKISILPNGEMILHAHEIEHDDEKASNTMQVLGRLGQQQPVARPKSEHRCGEVKRVYTKAIRSTWGLGSLQDSELKVLPERIRLVVNARRIRYHSLMKHNTFKPVTDWENKEISRDGIRGARGTLARNLYSAIQDVRIGWESKTQFDQGHNWCMKANERVWLLQLFRTNLWRTVDVDGMRAVILSVDQTTLDGPRDEVTFEKEWRKFCKRIDYVDPTFDSLKWAKWHSIFQMVYLFPESKPRVLAWSKKRGFHHATAIRGMVDVNHTNQKFTYSSVLQVCALTGPTTYSHAALGWSLRTETAPAISPHFWGEAVDMEINSPFENNNNNS